MIRDNLKVIRGVFIIVISILLLIIFFSFIIKIKNDKIINDIKEYIKEDTKIIYISDYDNYSKYPIELFKKYDIDYFFINSDNLSNIEKIKLRKIINSNYLSNIIVIFENGIIKDAIIEYESEDKLNDFLNKYDIIPYIIGDNSKIIDDVKNFLLTDYSILYLPYEYSNIVESQDKILKEISNEYGIFYSLINAYLLSSNQKSKLNSILKISGVDDQIVILIKNKTIVGSIREVNNKLEYLNKLSEFSFINELSNNINTIDYDEFIKLVAEDKKNIVVIGKDDCKYCTDVINILNLISSTYNININYINIKNMDSVLSKNIEKYLLDLGYSDGFTTPITIITEKNKLLDYIIGLSNEKYFIDIFSENGIIK